MLDPLSINTLPILIHVRHQERLEMPLHRPPNRLDPHPLGDRGGLDIPQLFQGDLVLPLSLHIIVLGAFIVLPPPAPGVDPFQQPGSGGQVPIVLVVGLEKSRGALSTAGTGPCGESSVSSSHGGFGGETLSAGEFGLRGGIV